MTKNTKQITLIAKDVYKKLGSGHSEAVYERAVLVGLRMAKVRYDSQKVVELMYKDHYVGEGYPDIIAYFGKQKVVLELKAVSGNLGASEEQQLRNYLKLLNIKDGLLINFQQPGKKDGKTAIEIREVKA